MGNPNRDHFVAAQIFEGFGRRIAFPRIMAIIRDHGRDFAYGTWNDVRQGGARDPAALFLWKVRQNKFEVSEKKNDQ